MTPSIIWKEEKAVIREGKLRFLRGENNLLSMAGDRYGAADTAYAMYLRGYGFRWYTRWCYHSFWAVVCACCFTWMRGGIENLTTPQREVAASIWYNTGFHGTALRATTIDNPMNRFMALDNAEVMILLTRAKILADRGATQYAQRILDVTTNLSFLQREPESLTDAVQKVRILKNQAVLARSLGQESYQELKKKALDFATTHSLQDQALKIEVI